MTIAAAYLVTEGIVFGADSSTMVSTGPGPGGGGVLQLLNHSQKVFEIGQNSRLGLCTWGAGSLGNRSHRTVIAELAEEVNETTTVRKAAELLAQKAADLIKGTPIDFVGYFLGGWESRTHLPSCFQIEIRPSGNVINPLQLGLCSFSGMPQFFTRVFRGYDPDIPIKLKDELKNLLSAENLPKDFDKRFDEAFKRTTDPLVAAGFKDLPIREAIDFVYSYLHITIKAMKFKFGAPGCGGPIEVGFITTDRPFRWACHKSFASAILEQEADYEQ
jgi:hypothetical protein